MGWLKDFADPETLLSAPFNGKNILDVGNSSFALLDDTELDRRMDRAEVINDPAGRARAWGEIDKLATALAPGVPWLWDEQPMLRSADVNGVVNVADATWDLTHTPCAEGGARVRARAGRAGRGRARPVRLAAELLPPRAGPSCRPGARRRSRRPPGRPR